MEALENYTQISFLHLTETLWFNLWFIDVLISFVALFSLSLESGRI